MRTEFSFIKKALLIAPIVLLFGTFSSYAQVVIIAPDSRNNQVCQLSVVNGGNMQPNVGNKRMGTKEQRATSAMVQVTTTNASYDLIIKKPFGFRLSPTGADGSVVFSTSVSARGATSFTEVSGDFPIRLKRGTTNLIMNLTAEKLDGPFRSGNYEAAITLQCE